VLLKVKWCLRKWWFKWHSSHWHLLNVVKCCYWCHCDRWPGGLHWSWLLHQCIMPWESTLSHSTRAHGNPATQTAAIQLGVLLWTNALPHWRQQCTELCYYQLLQSEVHLSCLRLSRLSYQRQCVFKTKTRHHMMSRITFAVVHNT